VSPLVKALVTPSRLDAAPPPRPERGPRARTHRLLLAKAMALVQRGRIPSVPEVAAEARVSRATAYRYFGSRSALVTAVVGEALAPVRRFEPGPADGLQRVRELFDKTFPLFKQFEPHMRAALQLSLEHESLERMGRLEEEPYRRGHRRYMLHRAAAPLRAELGPRGYERLLKALSLIYGIESYVVLRDIWGSSYRDVEAIARWMVEALVESALRRAPRPRGRRAAGSPRRPRRSLDRLSPG
jgi:AcrR family transcriptional regulator